MKIYRYIALLTAFCFNPCHAHIQDAKANYVKKNYAEAKKEFDYLKQIGNAEASLQLGGMYFRGDGVTADLTKAFAMYMLAYAQGHEEAKQYAVGVLKKLPEEQHASAKELAATYVSKWGKDMLLPFIKPSLTEHYKQEPRQQLMAASKKVVFGSRYATRTSHVSSAVLDYQIAPDGSVRDVEVVHNYLMDSKSLNWAIKETAEKHYTAGGSGGQYARNTWAQKDTTMSYIESTEPEIFNTIKKLKKQAKQDEPYAMYEYGMLVMAIPALDESRDIYLDYIKKAAEKGVPEAQTEQSEQLIQKGLYAKALDQLLSAAQAGHSRAQYLLGRNIYQGLWLQKNEPMAVFWLTQAVRNENLGARRYLAKALVSSENKELRNPQKALELLEEIKQDDSMNPNWHYLQALALQQTSQREDAKKSLTRAISMAKEHEWLVTEWDNLAASM